MIAGRLAAALTALALAATGCAAARAEPPGLELRVAELIAIERGETAALSVTLAPGPGLTVSAQAPTRLELTVDDGVVTPRRRYDRRDAADPAADAPRFDVRLRAAAVGEHALALEARAWVCAARTCRPVVARRTVIVRVPAPPVDAGVDAPIDAPIDAPPPRRRGR